MISLSVHPLHKRYMARLHTLWNDAGMKNLPAQRLSTQVKNIEKNSTLPRLERQQIHANVTGKTRMWRKSKGP